MNDMALASQLTKREHMVIEFMKALIIADGGREDIEDEALYYKADDLAELVIQQLSTT